MKYLKSFETASIDRICINYGIENYTINSDGTVDVDGDVNLYDKGLGKLPLKFGKVTGDFDCAQNQLVSLEGSPKEVVGSFDCGDNQLTSLEGGPEKVGGAFYCDNNQLTTLEGSPKEVGGDFYCNDNKLVTLEGSPNDIGDYLGCDNNPIELIYYLFGSYKEYQDSLDYNYLRGTDIVKSRFVEALEEIGKKAPEKIKGYNYI